MKRTNNYDLIVVEGSDKVNLLTQMNPNTEKIDEIMKNNENTGIHNATELLSGTIHAITRTVKSASMFKFTAVSNYTAGDTFTVDGVQVTALLTSGEALGTGAYIIGSEVLCSLKDTLLTVYTQGGTVKIAEDAEKLGGNLPEYYAKQSELNNVKNTADSASSLSRQNSESINNINNKFNWTKIGEVTGRSEIQLPTSFNELYVEVKIGGTSWHVPFNIPFVTLTGQNKDYFHGFYATQTNSCMAQISANKNTVTMLSIIKSGNLVIDTSTMAVYYR